MSEAEKRSRRFPLDLQTLVGAAKPNGTRTVLRPQRHVQQAIADATRHQAPTGLGLDSALVRQRMVQKLRDEGLCDERVL